MSKRNILGLLMLVLPIVATLIFPLYEIWKKNRLGFWCMMGVLAWFAGAFWLLDMK